MAILTSKQLIIFKSIALALTIGYLTSQFFLQKQYQFQYSEYYLYFVVLYFITGIVYEINESALVVQQIMTGIALPLVFVAFSGYVTLILPTLPIDVGTRVLIGFKHSLILLMPLADLLLSSVDIGFAHFSGLAFVTIIYSVGLIYLGDSGIIQLPLILLDVLNAPLPQHRFILIIGLVNAMLVLMFIYYLFVMGIVYLRNMTAKKTTKYDWESNA